MVLSSLNDLNVEELRCIKFFIQQNFLFHKSIPVHNLTGNDDPRGNYTLNTFAMFRIIFSTLLGICLKYGHENEKQLSEKIRLYFFKFDPRTSPPRLLVENSLSQASILKLECRPWLYCTISIIMRDSGIKVNI